MKKLFLRKGRHSLPQVPVEYPSGTCVRSESGVFYIKGRYRYRIASNRILKSWSFPFVVDSSEPALARYAIAGKLGFRQGCLIKDMSNGKIYLISENLRREIVSPDFFDYMLFPEKPIRVHPDEANLHKEGEKIIWQQPPTSL